YDDHEFKSFGMDSLWAAICSGVSAYIYQSRIHEQADLRPTRPLCNCGLNRAANHGYALNQEHSEHKSLASVVCRRISAIIIALTFSCNGLGVMSIYWFTARPASAISARLESMDPTLAFVENNPVTTMAERVAEPLNRIVPISANEAAKLQKQLMQAGYSSP